MSDYLEVKGLLDLGYGIIPKRIMQDKNLSLEAKEIYAYLCSFEGNGKVAFPGVEIIKYHLGIGNDRYYKHRKMLVEQWYLTIRQNIENGKFKNNIFIINTSIKINNQEKNTYRKKSAMNKNIKKQYPKNQYTYKSNTRDSESNNNNPNNNNFIINSLINSDEKNKYFDKKMRVQPASKRLSKI